MIRVALVQMRCEKAALADNLAGMRGWLAEAERLGAQVVAFPEMNYTGYADPTRYPAAVIRADGPEAAALHEATRSFPGLVLAGFIEANPNGKPYIAHQALRGGRVLAHYRKVTIEDEEVLWFSPGQDVAVVEHAGLKIGLAICADVTNRSVFERLRAGGAQVVLEMAAPGLYGDQAARNWKTGFDWWQAECNQYLSAYARDLGLWIAVATQAGRTVDEDFPGGAFLFAPDGRRVFATPDWREGLVVLDIDLEAGCATVIQA